MPQRGIQTLVVYSLKKTVPALEFVGALHDFFGSNLGVRVHLIHDIPEYEIWVDGDHSQDISYIHSNAEIGSRFSDEVSSFYLTTTLDVDPFAMPTPIETLIAQARNRTRRMGTYICSLFGDED